MEAQQSNEVSNKIFTLPNFISFIRLLMIPIFLVLLFNDLNLAATLLFAIAASTDWVDGQIARKTNQVSRLGQLLDPAVDRLLMIAGVAGLFFVGRLPLWIILFVLIRDLILLFGGGYILKHYQVRVAVIYPGKVATTLLYIGFAGILLNFPLLSGLGICDLSWLPGFSSGSYSWGFWFVYAGLVMNIFTTSYYIITALKGIRRSKRLAQAENSHG
jgi:cardiolipin synthase